MDIAARKVTFSYDYDLPPALQEVTFSVERGELVAVIGTNGSGKSTLAKELNALLPLQEGELTVLDMDVADEQCHHQLRRNCGMVFQNPDNQFVSSVVEEDVAFGLYNYDVPEQEIEEKVRGALAAVDMTDYARRAPYTLSGGQKQRVALAGIMALGPRVVIFDEATSMLDPEGKAEVMMYLKRLRQAGVTVLMITHFAEEAAQADRVLVMKAGRLLAQGTPREVLTDRELLAEAGLLPPFAVEMYEQLKAQGIELPRCPLTEEELAEELCGLM